MWNEFVERTIYVALWYWGNTYCECANKSVYTCALCMQLYVWNSWCMHTRTSKWLVHVCDMCVDNIFDKPVMCVYVSVRVRVYVCMRERVCVSE